MGGAQEWFTPSRYTVPAQACAADDVFEWSARAPGHAAFARKAGPGWDHVTSGEYARQVSRLAAGLIAAGIGPGDRVALMSATRYEWALCDFAIWTAGAVTVPIYETSSVSQVEWILSDSGAVAAFVENDHYRAVVARAQVPAVRHVWQLDDTSLAALAMTGEDVPDTEVSQRRLATGAAAPATIVYTSGTTGRPKGCVLSHANLIGEVRNVALADGVSDTVLTADSSILLFLPLAHILARVVQLAALHNGVLIAHTSDLKGLVGELESFRPAIVLAVPRVFERLYNTASRKAAADGHARIFQAAESTAIAYSRALEHGRPGWWLRARRRVFDRLVYRKLRAVMGGRVSYAVSGGAPLAARLGHFLRGAGVTILEGYGLTETSAGVTLNLPGAVRIGTVGRPLPGWAVRLSPSGEVLVKGTGVFSGYWHDEQATATTVARDGWLRTGDLGSLDNGFLTITGRQKDLIVTSGGKNVAPAFFEDRLRAHWLIDQCVLVGDQRPFVGALVTLDVEAFSEWKREHGKPETATVADLGSDADLTSAIQAAIDEVNQEVSRAESIRKFRIVAAGFHVSDELTPTQKVRRDYVLAKFDREVRELYEVKTPERALAGGADCDSRLRTGHNCTVRPISHSDDRSGHIRASAYQSGAIHDYSGANEQPDPAPGARAKPG
jgi:long-chain acyl-CoA synthetase